MSATKKMWSKRLSAWPENNILKRIVTAPIDFIKWAGRMLYFIFVGPQIMLFGGIFVLVAVVYFENIGNKRTDNPARQEHYEPHMNNMCFVDTIKTLSDHTNDVVTRNGRSILFAPNGRPSIYGVEYALKHCEKINAETLPKEMEEKLGFIGEKK